MSSFGRKAAEITKSASEKRNLKTKTRLDRAGGFFLALTTVESPPQANRLAKALVRRRLAACVNILPGAVSHYRWKGRLERSNELLLLIKTGRRSMNGLNRFLRENHPYELPELIFIPIARGEAGYLRWLDSSLETD